MRRTNQVLLPFLLAGLLPAQATLPKAATKPATRPAAARTAALLAAADEVAKEVAELRGKPFKSPVKKAVRTEQELRAYLEKELFEDEYGGGRLERHQWMMESMGLLPKGTDFRKTLIDVLLNQVGGFYDPKAKSFYIMARAGRDYGDFVVRLLMAHELTHALDDQYYALRPLMKRFEGTEDGGFAVGAVVEGSATALMTRWMLAHMKDFGLGALREQMKAEAARSKVLFEAPRYFLTIVARYTMGMRFLLRGASYATAGRRLAKMPHGVAQDLSRAMEHPPVSSEQILHPEKYWDAEKLDPPVVLADEAAFEKALLAKCPGFEVAGTETLGELLCAILAGRPGRKIDPERGGLLLNSPSFWTNRAAAGWGGDRVFLLRKDGRRGILWLTWWDEPKDAAEFRRAFVRRRKEALGFEDRARGRLAVFVFGALTPFADELFSLAAGRQGAARKGRRPFPLD